MFIFIFLLFILFHLFLLCNFRSLVCRVTVGTIAVAGYERFQFATTKEPNLYPLKISQIEDLAELKRNTTAKITIETAIDFVHCCVL